VETPQYAKSLSEHYSYHKQADAILDALRAAGKDPDNLTHTDLASVDQFHSRGLEATREMANLAGMRAGERVLDVGGGIGGAARTLAAEFGCEVTVLDLTKEFCRVGEMLTTRTRLSDRVKFQHGNALDMPFPDASFDVAWTQHSTMNIPDKERLYAEIARVVRPGGRLAMHEIMAGKVQPPHYPVPWARTPDISFISPPETVRALIANSGFREIAWQDQTQSALEWFSQRVAAGQSGASSPVSLQLILGDVFAPAFANQVPNLKEDRIAIIMAVFERT
jgi:SAM-dependent methyltransferase